MSEDGSTALTETPVYDQQFFIQLALQGQDVWNTWRRDPENSHVNVTFARVNFCEEPQIKIDFSGYEFANSANFYNATFRENINFGSATFGESTTFAACIFIGGVEFTETKFGVNTNFIDTHFRGYAGFDECEFKYFAYFNRSVFEGYATFRKSILSFETYFDDAIFKGKADFSATNPTEHSESQNSESDVIQGVSFKNASFFREVSFANRKILYELIFINTNFFEPPIFDNVSGAHLIDLTGANIRYHPSHGGHLSFQLTPDTDILLRFRAFRKIAEDTKNHDLERDLYIEERKAERGVYLSQYWTERSVALNHANIPKIIEATGKLSGHTLWIAVMGLYALFADYGRSFMRPLIALGLSIPLFRWAYHWSFSDLRQLASDTAAYDRAIDMVARGNAVPFVGPLTIDADIKKFLFCGKVGEALKNCAPVPSESYQWLVLTQNLVSITLVFFIGLALRNYFKIK